MKKFLAIIILIFFNTALFAETITLTRCYTISDSQPDRFSGPWANVWGIKNNFDENIFKKKQYVFDTSSNELILNYRFTENYHKILTGDNESQKKKLEQKDQENVMLFEIPIEHNSYVASERKGYSVRYDTTNELFIMEKKFSETSYVKNKPKYEPMLMKKGYNWDSIYVRITIDLKNVQVTNDINEINVKNRSSTQQCRY